MIKLKDMLLKREHPLDIIKYIRDNYTDVLKARLSDQFIFSMLNPERLKPKRYISYFPTRVFYIKKSINVNKDNDFLFQFDLLFDKGSKNASVYIDKKADNLMNIHEDIVKMYRITASCLLVKGEFIMNNKIYSDKKITYIPDSLNNMNYKFINSDENKQDVKFKTISPCLITIIQHIEFVPMAKNLSCGRTQTREVKIYEKLFEYKSFIITDYNVENVI